MGGGLVDLDNQFQRDMETAQTRSRAETPDCLPAEQVIQLGIGAAGNMGIFCTRPDLPLAGNSFVPMDGNCIQSSCCHSNDPTLNGEPLKHAAWELRVTCVGAAVENLNNFSDLQWSVLQGIVSGEAKETLSREETQLELEKYMESGSFSGNVGDILPQLAADNLNQPLLVIEIEKCRVKNATWVVPGAIFGGGEQHEGDPIVLVKQLQHYEPLLTKDKESARLKYQQWKASERVHVSGGQEVSGRSDDQGGRIKDVSGDSLRFEEIHQCNCGHKGPIASHLRSSYPCLLGMREELSLGTEMSDEVLIVQTTLVLRGCPAAGCPGGSHAEMPDSCLSWWREVGWKLMQWQGLASDLDCADVREMVNKFVKELTEGYEQRDHSVNTSVLSRGNLGERPIEDPDDTFGPPPITSTPVQGRNVRKEGRNSAATKVSFYFNITIQRQYLFLFLGEFNMLRQLWTPWAPGQPLERVKHVSTLLQRLPRVQNEGEQ